MQKVIILSYYFNKQVQKVMKGKDKYNDWQQLIKAKEEQFNNKLKQFKRLIKIWRDSELDVKMDSSEKAILIQYARYLQEYNNIDTLEGFILLERVAYKEDLKNIKNQKSVFLGAFLIHQKVWRLTFTKIFIEKISTLSEQKIVQLFFLLDILTEGYINFSKSKFSSLQLIQIVSRHGLRYYTHNLVIDNDTFFLIFSIGVHKLPYYSSSGTLQSFSYVFTLTCQDVIHNLIFYNEKQMNKFIQNLQNHYDEDPKLYYEKSQLILNQQAIDKKTIYYLKNSMKNIQLTTKVHPLVYKNQIISELKSNEIFYELQQFKFRLQKFKEYQIQIEYLRIKNTSQYRTQAKHSKSQNIQQLQLQTMKNTKMHFKSHSKHLEILQKIPNFKYALTNQQRQVICSNGNLVVVGRSGTGKTTCAMLRLYSIELSIKMKEFNVLKRQKKIFQTATKCAMILLGEMQLTKNIFLTFSSILIDQIKKQYHDMIYQIKQKHSQKCKICQKAQIHYTSVAKNEDPIDKLRRIKQEQETKVVSLNYIQADDFPGFFTIQNFIKIIDKTISRPFYVQQKQRNKTNNNTIQIKHENINVYLYKSKQIVLKQRVQAIQVDYDFFLHHIWEKLPKQLTKNSKEFCLLTPSIVWAEIFSILKGSLNSYLCPGGHISFKMYLQHPQSLFNNQLQQKMQQYKKKVFKILKSYLQWCKLEKAFDLMDVVSHNLKEIQFYGYQGPKINYMFVDEVQDLTASTILLVSKMVINNIFYCGDTAQAITKGVSFRFQDLKSLFNKQYCKSALCLQPPSDVQNLTVNFRSHNSIIQIANTVVSSLEIFFPNSINKLKKQKSDLIGPKPFIILNQHESMIFQLLCSSSAQVQQQDQFNLRDLLSQTKAKEEIEIKHKINKKKKRHKTRQQKQEYEDVSKQFNNQQVIIVRNEQQKQNLPKSLTKGIVLTPQTAKGLQYDEIILYNFFSSCPIYDKWNSLFQHLECFQTYQDQQSFEKQLTRRDQQEKKIENKLSQQTKQKLGYIKQKRQYKTWNIKAKQSIKGLNVNLYHQLQTQLKILYTSITRARSVFVIYDSKIPKNLMKIWELMSLFISIDDNNVQRNHDEIREYVYINQKHVKYVNQKEKWLKAGSEMLARRDFQNAKKCFLNIKRDDLVQRIEAHQLQIKAQRLLFRNKMDFQKLSNYQKDDRKIAKARLQKQKRQIYKIYQKAGQIYQKWQRNFDAGEAYFNMERYDLALSFYKKINGEDNYYKMGICCEHLKNYEEALTYYRQVRDIEGMCRCYMELRQWAQLGQELIDHPQYTSDYQQKIALALRKKIVSEAINNNRIFCQYLQLLQKEQFKESYKRVYNIEYTNKTISAVIERLQVTNYEELINALTKNHNHFRQLNQRKNILEGQNCILDQQIFKLMQFKFKLFQQQTQLSEKKKNILYKLDKYSLFSSIQSLKANQQYNELRSNLEKIQNTSKNCKIELQQIQVKANSLFKNKKVNMDHLKQITEQISKCNIENHEQQKSFLHNKLLIIKSKKYVNRQLNIDQDQKNSIYLEKPQSYEEKRRKQIKQIQKQQMTCKLAQEIQIVVKNFQKFVDYSAQSYKQKSPHFFIRKMIEQLSDNEGFILLSKSDYIGNSYSCLILINSFQKLHGLSIKHILQCFLTLSKNNIENRKAKQKTQYQILPFNSDEKLLKAKNKYFLKSLSAKILQHYIPCFRFNGQINYEPLLNNLVFGLVLQGFYKDILIFLPLKTAWMLAYLFSSNEDMVYIIKRITNQFGDLQLNEQGFLFINDQFNLRVYVEARMMNVYAIQRVFITYDECQQGSFLCKKGNYENIDIDQGQVDKIYNQQVFKRIHQMRMASGSIYQQIEQIDIEIAEYQRQKKIIQQTLINKNIRKLLYKDRQKQELDLKKLQQNLSNAYLLFNQVKISRKQKQKIQDQLNNLVKNQSFQIQRNLYQKKLLCQKQAVERIQKYQEQIKANKLRTQKITNQIRQITQNFKQTQDLELQQIQLYLSRIKCERLNLKSLIPKQAQIQDQQQLVKIVAENIIKQRKKEIFEQQQRKKIRTNMESILQKSFIPQTEQYQFIKSYINKYWNSKCLLKIIEDGCNIDKIQKQNNNQIQICNIIMLYLAYIFNPFFCDLVNKIIEQQKQEYQKKITQQKEAIANQIHITRKLIGNFDQIINECYFYQRKKKNDLEEKKDKALKQQKIFEDSLHKIQKQQTPYNHLLGTFLSNMYKKLYMALHQPNSRFLQILFGFFQCKIIKQCQPLQFLEGEYILVEHNSIVIDKLQNKFAYFFDQQNKNILCRLDDVKQKIINYIKEKHLSLLKKYSFNQNFNIALNINQSILQSKKIIADNYRLQKISLIAHKNGEKNGNIYEQHDKDKLLNTLAIQKQNILQFFLRNQFKDEKGYFFAIYQLRQYYFLQKLMRNAKLFNYQILKEVTLRVSILKKQYINR